VGIQFLAPAMEDARLYHVGAVLENILEAKWGKTMMDFAPKLENLVKGAN
jgi:aspartyl-tRNA(Asn)/glutamyl-tRNA(Gln) amidotransferase subunit A